MLNPLDRHLRRPDQHDGLPFHAECPVCRQRAAGTLPSQGLLSRQTQAALAAGVMAVSVGSPAAALAHPPDDGTSSARAPAPPADPTLAPDWQAPGPEGESGSESIEQAPPASDDGGGGGDEERGAVESEPTTDALPEPDDSEEPPAPAPDSRPAELAPAPESQATPPPDPAVEPPGVPVDTVEAPTVRDPAAETAPAPKSKPKKGANGLRQHADEGPRPPVRRAAPAPVAPQPAVQTEPAVAASGGTETVTVSRPASSDAPIKGETYKVQPGDSLWSIAERLLGPGASAGEVAREVHRLWTLNEDRIATGDPDLLPVGRVLRLP